MLKESFKSFEASSCERASSALSHPIVHVSTRLVGRCSWLRLAVRDGRQLFRPSRCRRWPETVSLTLAAVAVVGGGLGSASAAAQSTVPASVGAFGDAGAYGVPAAGALNAPLAGIAATPDGHGYWLLGANGGVFTYGDAGFYGSATGAYSPAVGIAPTPDGQGYWIARNSGAVYNFGDASSGGNYYYAGAAPVVGIAATPKAMGYWLVAADGGVFSFGSAGFFGSMGGKALNAPVVGMASTPVGMVIGWWLRMAGCSVSALPASTARWGRIPRPALRRLSRWLLPLAVGATGSRPLTKRCQQPHRCRRFCPPVTSPGPRRRSGPARSFLTAGTATPSSVISSGRPGRRAPRPLPAST